MRSRTPVAGIAGSLFALGLFVGAAALPAQRQGVVASSHPAPPGLCAQFDIVAGTVQHLEPLATRDGDRLVAVELGSLVQTLVLRPHDVRAADFRLLVVDDLGAHELPRPACVTWRGEVQGAAGSWVAATLIDGTVQALVHMGDGDEWVVQPVREVQPTAAAALHVVYRPADSLNLAVQCGVAAGSGGPVSPPVVFDTTSTCEIACEADFQFYQANGSNVTNTQNDITTIVNGVSAIFQNDVLINYVITEIVVITTSAANPYTTNDAGGLLGQFGANWNASHTGDWRDVAHLFSGRNFTGSTIGIASLGVICNRQSAYSAVQSRFTQNLANRFGLSAHELGHNFNATHCDALSPCNIMCSGLGGCSRNVTTFAPTARNEIQAYAASVGCLAPPVPPAITVVSPATIPTFAPGIVQLTGSGFAAVQQVTIGGIAVNATVPNDTTLRFLAPGGLPLGPQPIQIDSYLGTASSQVTVAPTHPCGLAVNGAVLAGFPATWSFGGEPGGIWFLLISGVDTTTPFQGWPLIDGPTVVAFGLLDPLLGLGSFGATLPSTLTGVTLFSQVVELVPASVLTVDSTSAVRSTRVF